MLTITGDDDFSDFEGFTSSLLPMILSQNDTTIETASTNILPRRKPCKRP